MQQQKTKPSSPKPKFKKKPVVFSARKVLFIVLLLGAIVTGVLFVMTGANVYSGLSALIALVATVLALYPVLVPVESTATQSTSIILPSSPNNMQSRNIAQTGQPIFHFNLPLRNPDEFYGHNAARTTLITRISNGGSSSIVGERRAGKTWLLTYLQLIASTHSKLGQAYSIAYISAEHPRCKTLAGVVQWALEGLKIPLSSHDPGLQPLDQLSLGVRALKKQGTIPVLCIDEFEGFNNRQEFDIDFVEGLRAMTQTDGLILIIASKRPLKELIEDLTGQTSPLFNVVQQISLRPFTEKEAQDFGRDKSSMAGFTKKESDFFLSQSVLYKANGEPYWPPLRLQLVGQMLLDDKQDMQRQPLDGQLGDFNYLSNFRKRLDEKYQAVV
jgi:AAA domain